MKDLFPNYSIGHFINQPDSRTEFEITRFDEMEEPDVQDVHKHYFYEILWVDKGESRQTIDYQSYQLNEKSLFFISPGQVHEFEEWQPLNGGTIMFTGHFFLLNQQNKDKLFELSFLDNMYAHPNLELASEDFAEIRHTIDLLIIEKKRKDANSFILQSLLHILLLQIQRSVDLQSKETVPKRYIVIYKQFQNLVEEKFRTELTAGDYASILNITQHHLNRLVKKVTGKTATEVIRGRSILEAKRLLTFSDYTVSEIASDLGYFDNSYFAKIFKREVGLAPLMFRESVSKRPYPDG